MNIVIYTYSNPYRLNTEPYWDLVAQAPHFCVSQTMVNGLEAVYKKKHNLSKACTIEQLMKKLSISSDKEERL